MIAGLDPFGVLPWSSEEFAVSTTNTQAADVTVTTEATDLAAVIIPAEALAGSESASLSAQVVDNDAVQLSEASTLTQQYGPSGDSGSGSDGAALAANVVSSDAVAEGERTDLAVQLVAKDVSQLTESTAASNFTPQQSGDGGSGSDGMALTALDTLSDSATEGERGEVAAQLQGSDTGTGGDRAEVSAQLVAKETGAFAEGSNLAQVNNPSNVDGSTGAENTALAAQLQGGDAIGGSDKTDLAVQVVAKDSGTLAESTATTNFTPQQGTDSSTGSDGTALAALLTAAEAVSGGDKPDLAVQLVAKDVGQLAEAATATQTNNPNGADGGTGSDRTALAAQIQATEPALIVDPVQLVVNIVVKDGASVADAAAYFRPITSGEAITVSDKPALMPISGNTGEAIGAGELPQLSVLIVIGDGMSMAESASKTTERAIVRYTLCAADHATTTLSASDHAATTLSATNQRLNSLSTNTEIKECD